MWPPALQAGALGFLSKEALGNSLVEGIRTAADDRPLVSPAILTDLVHSLRQPAEANPLSARKKEIMQLVAAGGTNEQIARAGNRPPELRRGPSPRWIS